MLRKTTLPVLSSAVGATTLKSVTSSIENDTSKCCTVSFTLSLLQSEQFCLGDNERIAAHDLSAIKKIRSVQCGSQVDGTLCPAGFEFGPKQGK